MRNVVGWLMIVGTLALAVFVGIGRVNRSSPIFTFGSIGVVILIAILVLIDRRRR